MTNTTMNTTATANTAEKMTKARWFDAIRAIVETSSSDNREDALAFIDREKALLAKKKSASANTKAKAENTALKETILAALVEIAKPVTVTELQKSDAALAEYSNQKLSALLRGMVETDKTVVKTSEKKRSYFSVA